ncbi:MAG: pantetheine-phosphate adenylyltransferase [Muribaculaceae bacterium]|nr:pantetheine-phosphate adenylyltransferase [Muribaculaceae bacterium]
MKTRPSTDGGRTALFPGSFRPFTKGHASIVERGLALFDRVVIAVGVNLEKDPEGLHGAEAVRAIEALYAGEPRVEVIRYSGLTVEAAREAGAQFLLRGVRTVKDFEYERDMADVNRKLSGLETVLLYSLPELSAVSSSIVRELERFGADTSEFLP